VNLLDEASSRRPLRVGDGWIARGAAGDVVVLSGAFDRSTTGVLGVALRGLAGLVARFRVARFRVARFRRAGGRTERGARPWGAAVARR